MDTSASLIDSTYTVDSSLQCLKLHHDALWSAYHIRPMLVSVFTVSPMTALDAFLQSAVVELGRVVIDESYSRGPDDYSEYMFYKAGHIGMKMPEICIQMLDERVRLYAQRDIDCHILLYTPGKDREPSQKCQDEFAKGGHMIVAIRNPDL